MTVIAGRGRADHIEVASTAIAAGPVRLATRHSGAVVLLVGAVSATAALARRQPLSWDEAVTVAVATRPVHAITGTLHHTDAVLGAYYLLMHGWGSLLLSASVHPTESWWRLPSAVAAVATCLVVAALARRLAGPVAALWAGSLLAVLPLFAFYTVDARPYTVATATVVGAWAVWTRSGPVRRPLLSAAIVVLLLVAAAWLQLFTVLVWPAFLVVGGRRSLGRGVATLVLAACGVAPLVGVAAQQGGEIAWIPHANAGTVASVVVRVGGGVAVTALLVALAAIAVRAHPGRISGTRLALGWWCCAPLAVLASVDVVHPVLVARYALVSLPLVAVAVAVVVARAAPGRAGRPVRALGTATLVAAALTSVVQGSQPWKYEDYRGAAVYARRHAPTGTPVLFAPSSARLGFDAYTPPGSLRDLALPAGIGRDPLALGEETLSLLREQLVGACRVVLVGDALGGDAAHLPAADRAKLAVVSGWHVDTGAGFGAVTVTVLTNPACPTGPDGGVHTPYMSPRAPSTR